MQMSWRCPTDQFSPLSATVAPIILAILSLSSCMLASNPLSSDRSVYSWRPRCIPTGPSHVFWSRASASMTTVRMRNGLDFFNAA